MSGRPERWDLVVSGHTVIDGLGLPACWEWLRRWYTSHPRGELAWVLFRNGVEIYSSGDYGTLEPMPADVWFAIAEEPWVFRELLTSVVGL